MSAIMRENQDNSYTVHFTQAELEVITALLMQTRLGNGKHANAAFNLIDAIENCIGSDGLDDIQERVEITVTEEDGADVFTIQEY